MYHHQPPVKQNTIKCFLDRWQVTPDRGLEIQKAIFEKNIGIILIAQSKNSVLQSLDT